MYYICNHKANLSKQEYQELVLALTTLNLHHIVVICPSSCYLGIDLPLNQLSLGAQDVSRDLNGAHTGEVTASQLKSLGVTYSLIGHSERRSQYHETPSDFIQKITNLINVGITPIFCIGETQMLRKEGETLDVLRQQVKEVYDNLSKEAIQKTIIAYEPLWSIGSGVVPSNEEIAEVIVYLKTWVKETYQINPIVLYGGSVNEDNINHLRNVPLLDGFLLGGVSLKRESLTKILTKDE